MGLHKKNKHKKGYDFTLLCKENPELLPFVFVNPHGTETIKFSDPKAVKALNTALLKTHYGIVDWSFSEANLCPPIPGRVEYIHQIANLLKPIKNRSNAVLDIGTGASCIYPLLGAKEYEWSFTGTDIDEKSLKNAQKIIDANQLQGKIKLKHQSDANAILENIFTPESKFDACICNPPFFNSEEDAQEASQRKMKGLKQDPKSKRNFGGTNKELHYKGGEKAFLHNYLYQSSLFKKQCYWFSSLVSKKGNIKSMQKSLEKLGATQFKIIPMNQGNKQTRIVAWSFSTDKELKS